jgi:F-type H+-transporting ATPase subunit a
MSGEHEAINSILPALPLPGLTHVQALQVEFTWLSMLVIITMCIVFIARFRTVPGGFQNVIELLTEFIEGFLLDLCGPKGMAYFPLVMTVFLFVGVCNYLGLIPGCLAPTSTINTTAAIAIVVFVIYQFVGITKNGLLYLRHFLGPIPILSPIILPIEIISEFARPFSLSVRLFANIFGGELIIGLLMGLAIIMVPISSVKIPLFFWAPTIMMLWESVLTAPIQAFVFSLLTMIYLGGAIMSEEEDH